MSQHRTAQAAIRSQAEGIQARDRRAKADAAKAIGKDVPPVPTISMVAATNQAIAASTPPPTPGSSRQVMRRADRKAAKAAAARAARAVIAGRHTKKRVAA